jgi:hypothetical protein
MINKDKSSLWRRYTQLLPVNLTKALCQKYFGSPFAVAVCKKSRRGSAASAFIVRYEETGDTGYNCFSGIYKCPYPQHHRDRVQNVFSGAILLYPSFSILALYVFFE